MWRSLVVQVAAKVGRVQFKGHTNVTIDADSTATDQDALDSAAQPAGLRAALSTLTPLLQAPGVGLTLQGFTMSRRLAAEIAVTAAPAAPPAAGWERLSITDMTWPAGAAVAKRLPPLQDLNIICAFNSKALAQLVRCVPVAHGRVCVEWGKLPSAPPAGVASLPWPLVVRVDCLDGTEMVLKWLKEAQASSIVTTWEIDSMWISLTTEQVSTRGHVRIAHTQTHTRTHHRACSYVYQHIHPAFVMKLCGGCA